MNKASIILSLSVVGSFCIDGDTYGAPVLKWCTDASIILTVDSFGASLLVSDFIKYLCPKCLKTLMFTFVLASNLLLFDFDFDFVLC